MGRGLETLKQAALARLKPSLEERARTLKVAEKAVEAARRSAERLGIDVVEVSIQGSIAKDTWISGDRDLDVFIMFHPSVGRRGLEEEGMKVAREAAMSLGRFIESYAEHPYVQAFIDDYRVDLVPCFKLSRAEEGLTAVDRTPFHTQYVNSRISEGQRDEVRLLKGFMKGIEVYGAEIKVQGFSGYLCELLVLYYGGFEQVLKEASEWRPWRVVIDLEGHYSSPGEALKLFKQPLVVIDPVDAGRNVAAALSLQKMAEFIAASRLFLKRPSELFFKPPPPRKVEHIGEVLRQRGTHLVAFKVSISLVPPDVLWGQLYKSMDGLATLMRSHGFEVLDSSAWSDESSTAILVFELPSLTLPLIERREGPPLDEESHVESFLLKHLGRDLKGPRVEGWRMVSYGARRFINVKQLLTHEWSKARLGRLIHEWCMKSLEVLVDEEVERVASQLKDFHKHLEAVFDGRPPWLRAYEEEVKHARHSQVE